LYKIEKSHTVLITSYSGSLLNYNNFEIFIALRYITQLFDTLQMIHYLRFSCVGYIPLLSNTLVSTPLLCHTFLYCRIHWSLLILLCQIHSSIVGYICFYYVVVLDPFLYCGIHNYIWTWFIMGGMYPRGDFCNFYKW